MMSVSCMTTSNRAGAATACPRDEVKVTAMNVVAIAVHAMKCRMVLSSIAREGDAHSGRARMVN